MSYAFPAHFDDRIIYSHQKVKHRKGSSPFSRTRSGGKPAYRPLAEAPARNKNLIEVVQQQPRRPARLSRFKNPSRRAGLLSGQSPFKKRPAVKKTPPPQARRPEPLTPKTFQAPAVPLFLKRLCSALENLPRRKPLKRPSLRREEPKRSSLRREESRRTAPGRPLTGDSPLPFPAPVFRETPAGAEEPLGASPGEPVKEGKSFSLPLVPAAILTGLAVFSILCLGWEGNPLSSAGELLPRPGEDPRPVLEMARYAGLETGARAGGEEELIPLDITGTFAWENYQVRKGDTVSRIAQAHALSYDAVISSNALPNARFLREGEILRLPNMDGIAYKVKAGDSLSRIASSKGIPLETILDANDLESNTIHEGMTLFLPGARMRAEDLQLVLGEVFMYPIRGRLTSPFGWRKDPFTGVTLFHRAVDLAASTGTPVKAARGGKIAYVGNNSVYGKYLILKHPGGYETLYAHLSQVAVAQGREVSQGEKIGEVGSTGYSTGPHLHFAVYKNGRAVNPLDYLNR